MSRTLRSALTIAQGIPGPSRPLLRPVVAPIATSSVASSRSLFDFANFKLPNWRRSAKKEDETDAAAPAAPAEAEKKDGGLFEEVVEEAEVAEKKLKKKTWTEHSYKSGLHKGSHRRLNQISRQVAGLPVDEAVVQLAFGDKRAGRTWVKSTLALARDHAEAKGLAREKLVVAETWVSKGPKVARLDIKGRGRFGIKHHGSARIHFVLREGKTWSQKQEAERNKVLRKVRSAGVVREDGKLRRKTIDGWAW
ncbi:54S ribosomal protein L22, mitochondrial [Vanrija pseudolonga]|uniref:54S ribosomal protein L22, mitochondrial n=1 Tax=Vanrija pseudolonga TaxID=143232 RepID=A0AAF0YD79_9TREE|nr:54S ribosomal protein L22, mitochondrial [Vanrija pseudolonga]